MDNMGKIIANSGQSLINGMLEPIGGILGSIDSAYGPNSQTGQSIGGGGGGTIAPVGPSQAQVNPILESIRQLDTVKRNKDAQSRAEYEQAMKGYAEQDALDRRAFDQNTFQNEDTYTRNNWAALLNAANSASGLRGVLSSLGSLAGSGEGVIERLVGLAANQDAGNARQTFDTNATNLNQAWGQAERQQRQRRADADALLANNLQNNEAQVLGSRQSLYQQLANMYGDGTDQGNSYASKAAALAAPLAKTTRATVAPYQSASSSFSPAALQQYLGGTQNLNASASGQSTTPANSPVYNRDRNKDRLAGVA